ncbi:MAG TPA: hypothetical protein VJT81_10785 [Burkholderiales bacterium]|nr:hypothetical protein [Burkholderiales bacterium]
MTNFSARLFFILCVMTSVVACTSPAVAITDRAMDSREVNAYNEYLRDAGRINIEREQAGLAPAPILSREEWAGKKCKA